MLKFIIPCIISLSCLAQTVKDKHQLLWEISGNGLKNKSYLFGSLHSNNKQIFDLSDSTYYALDYANTIILEADIFSIFDEFDTRNDDVVLNYDNEGNPYGNSTRASNTVYGDEDGMPQFLDASFQQYCYNAGKTFFGLETVDSQVDLMESLSDTRVSGYRYAADNELIELYLEGDIYSIDEYLRSSMTSYEEGYKRLIVERNFEMASKLDSVLKVKGNKIFCVVGAGHLAGGSGLINLLRSKGYKLRKVMASFSEEKTPAELNVKAKKSYDFIDEAHGIRINFPGKPKVIQDSDEDYVSKLVYSDLGQGNTYMVELYEHTGELTLEEIAASYVGSPSESPLKRIELLNGAEAYQGIADTYQEGLYWVRVIANEDYFLLIKAYGGNKFMNSNRAQRFFDKVWLD